MNAAKFLTSLRSLFILDLRSLALFRMGLGLMVMIDLAQRWTQSDLLYSDVGMLPQAGLQETYGKSIAWTSLHYHTGGSVALQGVMIAIGICVAFAMLIGYRTRWATVLTWILLISLNRRMPHSCYGADIVMRMLLFWGMFLPLGARWSMDRARSASTFFPTTVASVASAALILQVCYIYWFTALLKLHPDWLSGDALRYAMQIDYLVRPAGRWLGEQEAIARLCTYGTLVVEAFVPVLIVVPLHRALCRWTAILVMVGLHLGIAITMDIGLFPYFSILCWIPFIPTETYSWFSRQNAKEFSGEAESAAALNPGREHTTVLSSPKTRPITDIVVAGLLVFVTLYNVLGLEQVRNIGLRIPWAMQQSAKLLRLEQKWGMFAPSPRVFDGWYVMPAKLANGDVVDLWTEAEPNYAKPESIIEQFPQFRVRHFFYHHRGDVDSPIWPWVSRCLVRRWNAAHSPSHAVQHMQINFVGEAEHNGPTRMTAMIDYKPADDAMLPQHGIE